MDRATCNLLLGRKSCVAYYRAGAFFTDFLRSCLEQLVLHSLVKELANWHVLPQSSFLYILVLNSPLTSIVVHYYLF